MTSFDIILISNASTVSNKDMTERCISSIVDTEDSSFNFNIIVVEQNPLVEYEYCTTIHYTFPFNYNKCLNLGLKYSTAKYKGLCNNDLVFHTGWAYGIKSALDNGFGSVSPYCLKSHRYEAGDYAISGYKIGDKLCGWAIFLTDKTLSKIGMINEDVDFWYSDNIYAEQLKLCNIKHGLVCNSFVTHLGSQTLIQQRFGDKYRLTQGQKKAFEIAKNNLNNKKRLIDEPVEKFVEWHKKRE